jgi:hypothetical protein
MRFQSVGAYNNIDNYFDDIVTSWATAGPDEGGISVAAQGDNAAVFHAGAKLHVHAAPTTKGGVDYQIDADFVIRAIKWLHDGCAELTLGFDDASSLSPNEVVDQILSRHAHDATT